MRVGFVEAVLVFMFLFNVSSFPLMFFSGGVSAAIFFLSVHRFLFHYFCFLFVHCSVVMFLFRFVSVC